MRLHRLDAFVWVGPREAVLTRLEQPKSGQCRLDLPDALEYGYKSAVQAYQRDFVDLLVRFEALRFGTFTLKSGRKSPYFMNAGQLRTGAAMVGLGRAYAAAIERAGLACDVVFGPAYKGVPLAVATAMAFAKGDADMPYCFDRKEAKDHGEGGSFVGSIPQPGQSVVIVDDVITSGMSIRESVEKLQAQADVRIAGVVVAVDRQERGRSDRSTLQELEDELQLRVIPIVTIREIVEILHGHSINGRIYLGDKERGAIEDYLAQYGAS